MEILEKQELHLKIGKNGILADNSTLAAKLIYQDGISGFDKLLNGRSFQEYGGVILITKFPRGINIKLARNSNRYPVGIPFNDIQSITVLKNVLTIKLTSGRLINFLFLKEHGFEIEDFFNV